MKRSIGCLCVLLLLGVDPSFSQKTPTARIVGRVVETSSREPVEGANILLLGTVRGAATDEEGRFIIEHVTPGKYTLMATAIGYRKDQTSVSVTADDEIEVEFLLEETVVMMDGITVTASRYHQSVTEIPVSMSLVPATEIAEKSTSSIDQALRYVPGLNVLENGQINIRGSSGFNFGMGSRVLVLLNGNPMLTGDTGMAEWDVLPTLSVKQIEVMKGSGSALYGSSAMGGVINIITEEPEEGGHFHIRTFTGLYNKPSYPEWQWTGKGRHFEGTAVNWSTHIGPLSATLSSSYQTDTSYRENDDSQLFSFMTVLSYPLSANLKLDVTAGLRNRDGGYYVYWKSLRNPYGNGSDPYGFNTRAHQAATFVFPSITYFFGGRLSLSVKGRYHKIVSDDHLLSIAEASGEQEDSFRGSAATIQGAEIQLNWQVSPQGIIITGADAQRNEVDAIQYGYRQISKASYYTQYEQRLWKLLKVTLGARYDLESGSGIDTSGELSTKLGLNVSLSEHTHLRFAYAEGFRTPVVGERFVTTFTGGLRVAPNPSLKPEESMTVEVGLRQMLTKSAHLDFAAYVSRYDHLIEPQLDTDPDGAVVVRFSNVTQARVLGFDLSYRTDWWSQLVSTRIGYTCLDSKDLSPGEGYGLPLKYRSKHILYVSNDLNLLPFRAGIDFRYLSKIQRVDEYHKAYIRDIDRVVPTVVIALRFGLILEHYAARLQIDNLFQYNYLSAPANMAPPRTITLQLSFNT